MPRYVRVKWLYRKKTSHDVSDEEKAYMKKYLCSAGVDLSCMLQCTRQMLRLLKTWSVDINRIREAPTGSTGYVIVINGGAVTWEELEAEHTIADACYTIWYMAASEACNGSSLIGSLSEDLGVSCAFISKPINLIVTILLQSYSPMKLDHERRQTFSCLRIYHKFREQV
ncbi:hypothetical protein Tco_1282347 [Tanacetum coccineum]